MDSYTEKNYISISFHIEWDMIMVTVFYSILNQMEFYFVKNRKENCHHDHITFNVKGNRNIVFSVYDVNIYYIMSADRCVWERFPGDGVFNCLLNFWVYWTFWCIFNEVFYLLIDFESMYLNQFNGYEWAKQTKFLLAVIYMGRLVDIQTDLKLLRKSEKFK